MARIIRLSEAEVQNATEAGLERNRINREANKKSVIVVGSSIKSDIQGARAELAVAKAFGLDWTGRVFSNAEWKAWSQAGGRDVGMLEVRSTHYPWGHLPMFEKDHNDYPYVLVIVHSDSEYEIKGWVWGAEGKRREYWKDPAKSGKAYFNVPQSVLRSVESLDKLVKESV
jgi:hypothetical protein